MLTPLLAFATSPIGKKLIGIALVALMIAGLLGEIYHAGSKHQAVKYEAAQKVAQADVAAHEAKASEISSGAQAGLSEAKAAVTARFIPLTKRIPLDVSDQADHDCRVPVGFVSLWNAATASPDPGVSPGAR